MNVVSLVSAPELFLIEFPAVVKDADKAIQMLGGDSLIQDYMKHDFSPDLHWRRGDDFSKPLNSEKVLRRRKVVMKVKKSPDGKLCASLVGTVRFEVKFATLASCQYLPVVCEPQEKQFSSIQRRLLPIDLNNYGFLEDNKTPLFIMPPLFLRTNRHPYLFYRCKTLGEVLSVDCDDLEKYDDLRGNRSVNWFTVKFGDPIPTVEKHAAEISNSLSVDFPEIFQFVKSLFEERPIWSTTAVRWRFTNSFKGVINSSRMLSFLGQVAFYIENGPWQRLWSRIGYDPAKFPTEAKTYQVVDFRLSRSILKSQAFSETISAARSRNKGSHCFSQVSSVDNIRSPPHFFEAGVVPFLACTYFQVCDIRIDEIQRLVHSNDGEEPNVCHRVDGFLIKDYGSRFRRLMIASLIPQDKVQAIMERDLLSDKKKKKKHYRPVTKKSKGETRGDAVQNYISSIGATLGVAGNQEDYSSEDSGSVNEGSSSFEQDESESEEELEIETFMQNTFPDRPAIADVAQHLSMTSFSNEPMPSSSNTTQSRPGSVDLRRLWQETSTMAAEPGEGESTLDFPQL